MTTLNTTNTGKIGGSGTLDANVTNTGTLYAMNGTYEVTGSISGAGVLESDASGDLRMDAGVTGQRVLFADPTAMLTVEKISSFAPTEIDGFGKGNAIDIAGQPKVVESFNTLTSTLSLTLGNATTPAAMLKFTGATYTAADFVLTDDFHGGTLLSAPCFAAGTHILTDAGEVPVEKVQPGMRVVSLLHRRTLRVTWVGSWATSAVAPVRIAAGAFGGGMPRRDLFLSPDHSLFLDGALIPVRYLLNGVSIAELACAAVTYFHVEVERHAVLLAEALPCESYLDTGNRLGSAGSEREAKALAVSS